MWNYEKRLQFPVKICRPDAKAAKVIITQFGGPYCTRYNFMLTRLPPGLLEVELFNKGFDRCKYERFLAGQYRQFMTVPPDIFVAAAKPIPNVKYVPLPITKAIP